MSSQKRSVQDLLLTSDWITYVWGWIQTFITKAAVPALFIGFVATSVATTPGEGLGKIVLIIIQIGLDFAGAKLLTDTKGNLRHGLFWFGLLLITVTIATSIVGVLGTLWPAITPYLMFVDDGLQIVRAIISVIYGVVMHGNTEHLQHEAAIAAANDELALANASQLASLPAMIAELRAEMQSLTEELQPHFEEILKALKNMVVEEIRRSMEVNSKVHTEVNGVNLAVHKLLDEMHTVQCTLNSEVHDAVQTVQTEVNSGVHKVLAEVNSVNTEVNNVREVVNTVQINVNQRIDQVQAMMNTQKQEVHVAVQATAAQTLLPQLQGHFAVIDDLAAQISTLRTVVTELRSEHREPLAALPEPRGSRRGSRKESSVNTEPSLLTVSNEEVNTEPLAVVNSEEVNTEPSPTGVNSEQESSLRAKVFMFITNWQREQGRTPTLEEITTTCKCSKNPAIRYRREWLESQSAVPVGL